MTATVTTPTAQQETWYFTFGSGQQHDGKYVVIPGTYDDARDEMFRHFGNAWSFQYASPERAGVEEFGLVELPRAGWPEPATTTHTSDLLADPDAVALLRDLYAHARHVRAQHHIYSYGNGRSQTMAPVEHTWTAGNNRVLIHDGWLLYLSHGAPLLKVQIDTVRQAGQLLAAIGVLPQRFIAGGAR